ncbi:CAMK/CAMKL/CHK1 protein kinase [Sphaeroforma arctica JP610]|uniref:CAMK/CAMKL/CHK1 protein kinase n=1 Tax=Sphaeroforma arctica JP610 TaxID=667725 RepID=A0A0L0G1H7_9EUKA|nr:CAMK/CAMKL/CHK1 protein kinase [Sphaeroforma arctica JP610]KNC82661.1 CAMK/CAMKL/CHK1 protein kinase [Sphaeroforma arctica JP610]|eukprot:XP_014156563.1 CAMK/CAMKL/CHK1 protein kinase [Sphaeroforma arctica JP610]
MCSQEVGIQMSSKILKGNSRIRGFPINMYNTHYHKYGDVQDLLREYVVIKTLSQGSTAEVFLAKERATGALMVVKEQRLEKSDIAFVDREAMLHSRLHHPNIVALYETAKNNEVMVLLQEYMGGGELYSAVIPNIGAHPMRVRHYFTQLVSAIRYMHDVGVAHRDIKLENVCLDSSKKTAKLVDFGLSECVNERPGALYKRHVGTIPYMAAELWYNQDATYVEVDIKATDVWALGVLLFCLLVGRFPWGEASHRSKEYQMYLRHDFTQQPWRTIPDTQSTLLIHMLDVNPARRWTSAQVERYIYTHWAVVGEPQNPNADEYPYMGKCRDFKHSRDEHDDSSDSGLGGTHRLATDSRIESMNTSSNTLYGTHTPVPGGSPHLQALVD